MLQRSPDFVGLMTAMMAGMGDARATITAEIGGATTSTVTQFSVAGLAVDPVTG
jgi:hypothetical protein